jgi:membrane protein insertase Oxa1/YidC/SpoIIIJ
VLFRSIFYKGGLPSIDVSLLYSFVKVPEAVDMHFLGFFDMVAKSLPLALAAGITQYFQVVFSMPKLAPRKENASMTDDLARSMNMQMRYFMPVLVAFIAYGISGAIALYWTTSNLFTIGQEIYIRRKLTITDANTTNTIK